MQKILVSHEIPKVLLPYHDLINNFSYVLAHLLGEDEEYSDFYKKKLQEDEYSILDCSTFELGKSIDSNELWDLACEYEPTHLVLPDKLHDKDFTIEESTKFIEKHGNNDITIKFIGVVQGQTFDDLIECCNVFYNHSKIDTIAIPFDCLPNSVDNIVPRVIFFREYLLPFLSSKFINHNYKKIHFLGVQSPSELLLYSEQEKQKIYSIDTSSPIIYGWNNIRYGECGPTKPKFKDKLADNLDKKLNVDQIFDIIYNVNQFKNYYLNQ